MDKLSKEITELVDSSVKRQLDPLFNMLDSLFIQLLLTNTVDGQQLATLLQNFEPPVTEDDKPPLMTSLHARILFLSQLAAAGELAPLFSHIAENSKQVPDWLQGVISSDQKPES
jgi:hypothetical protein